MKVVWAIVTVVLAALCWLALLVGSLAIWHTTGWLQDDPQRWIVPIAGAPVAWIAIGIVRRHRNHDTPM